MLLESGLSRSRAGDQVQVLVLAQGMAVVAHPMVLGLMEQLALGRASMMPRQTTTAFV